MNANAAIAAYEPTIDILRPHCGDAEKRLRCGILYLRDRANAARRRACWEACVVLHAIESLATVHAFASMAPEELETLNHALTRMMLVAQALEVRGPKGDMSDVG